MPLSHGIYYRLPKYWTIRQSVFGLAPIGRRATGPAVGGSQAREENAGLAGEYTMNENTSDTDTSDTGDQDPTEQTPRVEQLEAETEELREENQQLRERLAALEEAVDDQPDDDTAPAPSDPAPPDQAAATEADPDGLSSSLSRRGALAGLVSLGLLGIGASPASAGSTTTTGSTTASGGHLGEQWDGTTSGGYGLRVIETSSSGYSAGVRGESDSDSGQGLQGVANSSTGRNYGVNGVTLSDSGVGVRGKAPASSGNTFGVLGVAESPSGKALQGTNFATSGSAIGLEGRTNSTSGVALRGRAKATSGTTTGVSGLTNSSGADTAAVEGRSTAGSGQTYGVHGKTASSGSNATGVRGHATASGTAAETYGVDGRSDADADSSASPEIHPAGVHAKSTGSGITRGVHAEVDSKDGRAIVATANKNSGVQHPTNPSFPSAIWGTTDRSGADSGVYRAYGVVGYSTATSGAAVGVIGQSSSPDGTGVKAVNTDSGGYALLADGDSLTNGNHEVEGNHKVNGHVDVSAHGTLAFLSADQTIPSATDTTVAYDTKKRDDFSGFDTSTGKYTVQKDGDYQVDFQIDWKDSFSSQTVYYELMVNGSSNSPGFVTNPTEDGTPSRNWTKPIYGLTSGDTIEIQVYQASGSGKDIEGWSDFHDTFISIRKIG